MRSFKLFLTAFAALFAGAAIAAPEPTVPAPVAKTVQAVESIQKAKPAADLTLPAGIVALPSGDDLFQWFAAPDGRKYLVYAWEKPAVVFSLTMAAKQKVLPGREALVVAPPTIRGMRIFRRFISWATRTISSSEGVTKRSTAL